MPSAHFARVRYLDDALARREPSEPCPVTLARVYNALLAMARSHPDCDPQLRELVPLPAPGEPNTPSCRTARAMLAELGAALERGSAPSPSPRVSTANA
jgi:hypothetical protein